MTQEYNRRKNSNRYQEIIKYLISVCIIVGAVFASRYLASLIETPATQESNALIAQVDVDPVSNWLGSLDLVVPGTVRPHREIRIASEVGGRVTRKYPQFQAGRFVVAGTKLAEIDPQDYQADLNVLQADLEQSKKRREENSRQIEGEKRNVDLAKQNLSIEQREFNRVQRLASALSRSEVDQARRALNNARTNLTARENALELLKASATRLQSAIAVAENQLRRSEITLRRVTIKAPVDGVIVSERVQENNFVRVGDEIAIFEDTSVAEVRCNLTTSELSWIRKNSLIGPEVSMDSEPDINATADKDSAGAKQPSGSPTKADPRTLAYQLPQTDVTIYESVAPDIQWTGKLSSFDGIGRDEVTKTIPCRIIVPQPIATDAAGPRALVRNMYVKCRIEIQTSNENQQNDLFFFDELALQPGNFVWKVVDSKLKKARVEVVDRTEKVVNGKRKGLVICRAIEGNLGTQDQVVVSPLSQPTENAEVIVAQSHSSSSDNAPRDKKTSTVSSGSSKK